MNLLFIHYPSTVSHPKKVFKLRGLFPHNLIFCVPQSLEVTFGFLRIQTFSVTPKFRERVFFLSFTVPQPGLFPWHWMVRRIADPKTYEGGIELGSGRWFIGRFFISVSRFCGILSVWVAPSKAPENPSFAPQFVFFGTGAFTRFCALSFSFWTGRVSFFLFDPLSAVFLFFFFFVRRPFFPRC